MVIMRPITFVCPSPLEPPLPNCAVCYIPKFRCFKVRLLLNLESSRLDLFPYFCFIQHFSRSLVVYLIIVWCSSHYSTLDHAISYFYLKIHNPLWAINILVENGCYARIVVNKKCGNCNNNETNYSFLVETNDILAYNI
jgi:hypothetical protein